VVDLNLDEKAPNQNKSSKKIKSKNSGLKI